MLNFIAMRNIFVAVVVLQSCSVAFAASQQPNIVVIFSDDHAYQAISAYGENRKLLNTPNIDRIGNKGVRFDRCLVTNSICGPSRATLLTGKYSHMNGFYNNSNSKFDGTQQTFPKLLQKAGYQTAVIGKWHLISDPTGFDYWHILPGQGIYYNPPMIRNGEKMQHQGYTTDLISDFSIDWLKNRDKSKPFLLMSQHKAPHREWAPALRHLGHDNDRVYPEPVSLFDDYSNRGLAIKDQDMTIEKTFTKLDAKLVPPTNMTPEQLQQWNAYYQPRNDKYLKDDPKGKDLVRWRYNRYMHDYLGTIKAVDESVGKMLDYLDKEGLAENTIVVYAADQGFFLGEHGWFDKRWILEESLRTPMLISWPKITKTASVNKNLTGLIDLAQTCLEAAGVESPKDMQGKSLLPILKGKVPEDWRKSFYYHYYEYPVPHRVRPHYGVITDRFKLVHFYKPDVDYWELYDREKDPNEMKSFYADPSYADVVKELKVELAKLRSDLKDNVGSPKEAYGNSENQKKKKQ